MLKAANKSINQYVLGRDMKRRGLKRRSCPFAEGIVGASALKALAVPRRSGVNERRSRFMTNPGIASVKQLLLPLVPPEDEVGVGERRRDAPVCLPNLLQRTLERSNMFGALKRVRQDGGAPGVDGMAVEKLPGYLKKHWPGVRAQLLEGRYRPQAVLRKEIPKAGGGQRELGIPTVLDRLIQQVPLQVMQCTRMGLPRLVNG